MRIRRFQKLTILVFVLAMPALLFADFSYQESSQITGGSIVGILKMARAFSKEARKAGEPIVTTVYLKGNRLANISPDNIEIIDLDHQTITHIDTVKRTYTVMTFQQMKEQVAAAQEEMQKKQAEHSADKTAPNSNPDNVKVNFEVHVRKTGAEKQVSGLSTSEAILTMTMNATDQNTQQSGNLAITNDMWIVPDVPGYSQMRDFYMRMAAELGTVNAGGGLDFSKLFPQNPGAGQALDDMAKEMQKIKGVPIMQVVRMGTTTDGKPLPAASEAPLPADSSPAMPSGSEIAKQSAASELTSHLPFGGFGGFGHKKKNDQPPPEQNANTPPPTSMILMESQVTSSNFSSDPVDPSHFDVPAGYKQLQPQMEKH
jgi:hypothetical protein